MGITPQNVAPDHGLTVYTVSLQEFLFEIDLVYLFIFILFCFVFKTPYVDGV